MKRQPAPPEFQPPVSAQAQNRNGSPSLPLLEHIRVPAMTVSTALQIIGINQACKTTMAHLCGEGVEVGAMVASIPLQIETAAEVSDTLEAYCRQSFSKRPYYLAGHCVGSRRARSMLLKFTPVLDAFSRPQMLHIMIQDFPLDPSVNEREMDHHQAGRPDEPDLPVSDMPKEDLLHTFESAPVGIAHVAPDGRFLRANRYLCEMLGYSPMELTTKTYREVTHAADLDTDEALAEEVLAGKRNSYVLEKRYLRKDGSSVWAYLAVALLRDEAKRPRYFICVVSNIHAQKQALVEVEDNRRRLKTVFDTLSEAVFVFNGAGEVIDANRAALRMFGYVNTGDAGASVSELDRQFEVRTLDAQLLSFSEWPIARILRGERVSNAELVIKHLGTGRRWIASFSGSRVRDGTGEPVLAVLTVRDVSKRHYAEALLRQSEQRFRTAFDHIPDMVVLYDTNLRIRYANHAMSQAVKASASSLIGRSDRELQGMTPADLHRPLLLAALETGQVQEADAEFPSPYGTRHLTATCVPLLDAKRQVEELMCVYHDYTERKHAEEKARHAALHDPLTRLPNRALLFEYARHVLGGARRRQEQVAVLFIDLDRFKPINDLHGHETGDEVLRQVAQHINSAVREEDMVFRLGGDEFLVLIARVTERATVRETASHLLEAIGKPYHVGPLALTLSASIGVSLYPDDGNEIDMLINHADTAMYHAKRHGRNAFQLYESWMSAQAGRQAIIEQDLKRAIAHSEFRLYYQPVIDMRSGRLISLEALIRWPGNSNSADRFVPIAEATGLIGAVGDWVLSEACRQHEAWKKAGALSVPIAINVSPVQFRRDDLAHDIETTLKNHGLESSAIQLELTETAVMDDIDRAIDVLGQLRAIGIKIALDDFGTGYSSLNYLSRLPLDKLKIDQTFVQRIEADSAGRAITDAVIVLGRTMGLTIVAEGIESASVMSYLRERGCHQGQGYFICKPLASEDLSTWTRERFG